MRNKYLILTLHFYRSFAPAALLFTIIAWYWFWRYGTYSIPLLVFLKFITDLFIYYFTYKNKRLYFYYNNHISKRMLWLRALLTDIIIFITGIGLIEWAT